MTKNTLPGKHEASGQIVIGGEEKRRLMEPAFNKKRAEKRVKINFPLEVHLKTPGGPVSLGRGIEGISRSGCRLRLCIFSAGVRLAEGMEYPVTLQFRMESFDTRIRVGWFNQEHCGVRLTEPVPFWPVKF